ncbi:embryo defective [Forsythia ovata]|uniref:Embryo defective n=1 Tax=Forsythia ovata TaxID=205694 RepID=A0ABD1PYD1_9LAMI
MEFLNSTVSRNCQISSNNPFLFHNFSITTRINKKYPSRVTIPNSRRFSLHPQFILCLPRSKKLQVSAHFGRTTNRQNYLRKKLTERQQQVNDLQNPVHKFNESDISESNFDSYGKENSNLDKRSSLDKNYGVKRSNLGENNGESGSVKEPETESRRKVLGESVLWNKLESWVEQYKKDTEMWGIGTGPIFTLFQDTEGKIKRVVVNEDEILRRSQVNPRNGSETEDLAEVNFKISFAKDLAREMERGSEVIPKNSSVVKFVMSGGKSGFLDMIQGIAVKPGMFSRMSRVGVVVLCGLFVVWAVKGLCTSQIDSEEYTRLEKEMLRRKMKARMEKEKMVKGSVEVMQDSTEPISASVGRPQLDKEEVVNNIIKANGLNNELAVMEYSGYKPSNFNDKIEEIRAMARHARELEQKGSSEDNRDGEDGSVSSQNDLPNGQVMDIRDYEGISLRTSFDDLKDDIGLLTQETSVEESETQIRNISNANGNENTILEVTNGIFGSSSSDLNEVDLQSDKSSVRTKLRLIKSVKEAQEYLSRKNHKAEVNEEPKVSTEEQVDTGLIMQSTNEASDDNVELPNSSLLSERSKFSYSYKASCSEGKVFASASNRDSEEAEEKVDGLKNLNITRTSSGHETSPSSQKSGHEDSSLLKEASSPHEKHNYEGTEKNEAVIDLQMPGTTMGNEVNGGSAKVASSINKENWIEKNFHEFEPIAQKIGVGFRDNYLVARENTNQELEPKSLGDDNELEWMNDERLRDIVFKVRENELSGRDPFYLIDDEDKCSFFSGLEKKVEQENEKLMNLHKYLHSNIENLDYGADGISLYDPPEKIIPRWKVPPAEKNPEFLNNFIEQRKELVAESIKKSFLGKKTKQDVLQKSEEPSSHANTPRATVVSDGSTEFWKEPPVSPKTIIEGSDGSLRTGKRSGMEYWEHTKKWSQGFLESYNAETDPEVKGVMRDIGKDLDRWITEKEIQEASELMDKMPEKGRKFVKEKLDKVKREMELFGPQAVVSKYREYAEEKEEDYLWWLDLPFVLCIELYTVENEEQKVGFYSLEMAADLELDPKQYHVIAFEDAGDCKNLCYIIQAQMEILGNGNAFIVARPPKDAFREAKENGFSVTVIRKGQLQLNVDQTLQEVEELIVEIGSKIYHDKIMQERSVDINGLMKGVFGISKPSKRKRSKRKLKRRTKL